MLCSRPEETKNGTWYSKLVFVLILTFATILAAPNVNASLLVSSYSTNQILKLDTGTGSYLGVFATIGTPKVLVRGPDGSVYVGTNGGITRFDLAGNELGSTGVGVGHVQGIGFGPDGAIYAADAATNLVFRVEADLSGGVE